MKKQELEIKTFDNSFLASYSLLKNEMDSITRSSKNVVTGYLELGKSLKKIKEDKLYEILNYQDIYEFAANEYNFKETAVKNLIAVFDKFSDGGNTYLKSGYQNFNYTQLVELVPVDENQLTDFNPEMSVKQIRIKKLETKAKKDSNKLIDFLKTHLVAELESTAKAKGLDYKVVVSHDDLPYWSSYSLEIEINTCRALGYSFYIKLPKDMNCLRVHHSFDYNTKKLDTSISLVLKYFNEFINKVLPKQKSYEEEQKKKKEEAARLKKENPPVPTKLKNNKQRDAYIHDLNNYDLLYDLKEINLKYYRCKEIPNLIIQTHSDDSIICFYWYERERKWTIEYPESSKRIIEKLQQMNF